MTLRWTATTFKGKLDTERSACRASACCAARAQHAMSHCKGSAVAIDTARRAACCQDCDMGFQAAVKPGSHAQCGPRDLHKPTKPLTSGPLRDKQPEHNSLAQLATDRANGGMTPDGHAPQSPSAPGPQPAGEPASDLAAKADAGRPPKPNSSQEAPDPGKPSKKASSLAKRLAKCACSATSLLLAQTMQRQSHSLPVQADRAHARAHKEASQARRRYQLQVVAVSSC